MINKENKIPGKRIKSTGSLACMTATRLIFQSSDTTIKASFLF